MFKKALFFGLLVGGFSNLWPAKKAHLPKIKAVRIHALGKPAPVSDEKVVAWDIHDVLFSKPFLHGWQCQPNPEMFKIVDGLKQRGIKQVIFSNISAESFLKLVRLYPEHFKYFDLNRSLAKADGIFMRKPHAKYMKHFLKRNKMVHPHNIIFFDDKESNTQSACEHGIDAYQVTRPTQVEDILRDKFKQ